MGFDGIHCNAQFAGNLGIAVSLRNQVQYVDLTLRQAFRHR